MLKSFYSGNLCITGYQPVVLKGTHGLVARDTKSQMMFTVSSPTDSSRPVYAIAPVDVSER
jgi:hypothetical protein